MRNKTLKILFDLIPGIESPKNLDKTISDFQEMLYQLQIIQEDFDWVNWEEGNQILQNSKNGFDNYDIDTLCKLITAIVRNDKYNENYLESKFTDGTILKIIKAMKNKNITLFEFFETKLTESRNYHYKQSKPKYEFNAEGLFDMYDKYYWNGDKVANKMELVQIEELFNSNKKEDIKNGCKAILKWGGVDSNTNIEKLNKIFIGNYYIEYFELVGKIIKKFDINQTYKEFKKEWDRTIVNNPIYMNSGFTKIYSLYFHDFVIYDSRVGAALAFFVNEYIEYINDLVDEQYIFSIPPSRDNDRRNPDKSRFKIIGQTPAKFFYNNLVANYLIKNILENSDSKFTKVGSMSENMRALEMALFMIGYDISKYKKNK